MYTIEDLEFSIIRLRELKNFVKDKEYNHSSYFNECGSPSCLLGWSTVLYPDEFKNCHPYDILVHGMFHIPETANNFGELCGIDVFKLNSIISQYLFAYCYQLARHNKLKTHRLDNLKETSLNRIDKIEEYLRRKLASLLAEQEGKTIHHQKIWRSQNVLCG